MSAFNVLNYFVSQGDVCGPGNGMDCRGADNPAELERQKAKLVPALEGLDADVLGIVEIENSTGVDPFNDPEHGLVTELNAATAPGTYAAIETGVIGSDAIRVGLVYQPGTVEPVGDFEVIDSSDDPRFRDEFNRPVLVQTFEELATGEQFTVAVNHLKSKGSDCNAVGTPTWATGRPTATRPVDLPRRRSWTCSTSWSRPGRSTRTCWCSATSTPTPWRTRSGSSRTAAT